MILYEQIKDIAESFERYSQQNYYDSLRESLFDKWASGPGKGLMMQIEDAKFGDPKLHAGLDSLIAKTDELIKKLTPTINVERPSNSVSVGPDKEVKDEITICPECNTRHPLLGGKCPFCTRYAPTIKKMEKERAEREAKKTNRHKALVREIAEEMTKCEYEEACRKDNISANWDSFLLEQRQIASVKHIMHGRIAVERMAGEFKAGYEQAASDYGYANAHNDSDINAYLIERGLIPEKEAGQDEKVTN